MIALMIPVSVSVSLKDAFHLIFISFFFTPKNIDVVWLNADGLGEGEGGAGRAAGLARGARLSGSRWSKGRLEHSYNVTWFLLLKSRGTSCYGYYSIDPNISAGCKGTLENGTSVPSPSKGCFRGYVAVLWQIWVSFVSRAAVKHKTAVTET